MNVSRREFLRLGAWGAAGGALAGCSRGGAPAASGAEGAAPAAPTRAQAPGRPTETVVFERTVGPQHYQEAPMLAERVQRGELPPVDERLPQTPLVLEPYREIGEYGGDLRTTFRVPPALGPSGAVQPGTWRSALSAGLLQELRHLYMENLLAFAPDLTLRPNIAESWEYSDDGTEITFHLRVGLRWSDGALFTTRDILSASPRSSRVVAPDDHTITYRRDSPEPDALVYWALFFNAQPDHYLRPQGADPSGVPTSTPSQREGQAGLFDEKASPFTNSDLPVLTAWHLEREIDSHTIALVRNPYYWQVDPAGNQLPYVDHLVYAGYDDPATVRMRLRNGEVDYQATDLGLADVPWLREGATDGGYYVALSPSTRHLTLHLNLATPDERLHPFFNDVLVRRAFMLAIDRDSLNRLYFDGLCKPRQFSPVEGASDYYERLSNTHVEYDPDRANALLDEAGYDARDGSGYRLHPDGSRVFLDVVGSTMPGTAEDECILRIVEWLADVGVEAEYRRMEWLAMGGPMRHNEILAAWMPDYHCPVLRWRAYNALEGFGINQQPWASGYGYYRYVGDAGDKVEPPEGHWIWHLWEAIDGCREEPDEARRAERFREVLDIYVEQVPVIGVLGQVPQPVAVSDGLRNVREGLPYDPQVRGVHLWEPQQPSWERPEDHVYVT
jgi:peptide/nickel transport system substrate-binding protein